ncbi:hypothetical protein ACFQFG_28005 [Methylobacterium persicinum]
MSDLPRFGCIRAEILHDDAALALVLGEAVDMDLGRTAPAGPVEPDPAQVIPGALPELATDTICAMPEPSRRTAIVTASVISSGSNSPAGWMPTT